MVAGKAESVRGSVVYLYAPSLRPLITPPHYATSLRPLISMTLSLTHYGPSLRPLITRPSAGLTTDPPCFADG